MSNSTQFYESTKALIELIIKNTEKENFNQTNFKKRKLSVPDNLGFKASFVNSAQNSDLTRSFNYTPIEKIFNVENARTNELLRTMMEKSNSVHVSPYISKSIGSHIKSQNDRSKRTKEIFKELRTSSQLSVINNPGMLSKLPSAPTNINLSNIREKLKNSGNFIKSTASAVSSNVNCAKVFGNDFSLNNSNSKHKSSSSSVSNDKNNFDIGVNLDFKNISSYISSGFNAGQANEGNFNQLNSTNNNNISNLFASSFNNDNNTNKTPVFSKIDKSSRLFFTPENNDKNNSINNNSNTNKFNLANSSESFNNNNENVHLHKEFELSKNLSFNFTEQEKDDNN